MTHKREKEAWTPSSKGKVEMMKLSVKTEVGKTSIAAIIPRAKIDSKAFHSIENSLSDCIKMRKMKN